MKTNHLETVFCSAFVNLLNNLQMVDCGVPICLDPLYGNQIV